MDNGNGELPKLEAEPITALEERNTVREIFRKTGIASSVGIR